MANPPIDPAKAADCCDTCDCGAAQANVDTYTPAWRPIGQPVQTALFISIACSSPGCRNRQDVGFSDRSETYGDLLDAIESAGWALEMAGPRVVAALCSACVQRLEAASVGPVG